MRIPWKTCALGVSLSRIVSGAALELWRSKTQLSVSDRELFESYYPVHKDVLARQDVLSIPRVLFVDVRGPTRMTGDGVRVMAMMMDIQDCGMQVDVISESNSSDLLESWSHDVRSQFLSRVHFWRAEDMATELELRKYARIIIGGKLDLLITAQAGTVVPGILNRLHDLRETMRGRVFTFWDDVPWERCHVRREAAEICPHVTDLVKKFAESSQHFCLLSTADKQRLTNDMEANGIPTSGMNFSIWPMRISNMQRALPTQLFTEPSPNRTLVTMMGNFHAVNHMMVGALFESGALEGICHAIVTRDSPVRISFFGGLAKFAEEFIAEKPFLKRCVDIRTGFISDEELQESIFPSTRAVLNPFFKDVNSGISVKNFESIKSRVPFITSTFGMHGLDDEVPECADFPMPSSDPEELAGFVVRNIVDPAGYTKFANKVAEMSRRCIDGQSKTYPFQDVCHASALVPHEP